MKNSTFTLGSPATRPKKKWPFIVAGTVLVLGLIGGGVYIKHRHDQTKERQATEKTNAEAQTNSAKKQQAESKNGSNSTTNLPANSTSITSDQVTTSGSMSASLSVLQKDGSVSAHGVVNGSNGSGTCVFSFKSPDGEAIKPREASSSTSGNTQTCSASIPEVEFTRLGSWTATLTYYAGNSKVEASQSVTIN